MYRNIQNQVIIYLLFFMLYFLNWADAHHNNKLGTIFTPSISSTTSNINLINWKIILLDMLQSVFFFDEITPDSILLVNIIKNNTNGVLQTVKITNILIELISENTNKYNVISMDDLYRAYRKLEISSEEILHSYKFSIEMAHYLKADYIIYSTASGELNNPHLELQLILSKTGEILRVVSKTV